MTIKTIDVLHASGTVVASAIRAGAGGSAVGLDARIHGGWVASP